MLKKNLKKEFDELYSSYLKSKTNLEKTEKRWVIAKNKKCREILKW